MMMETPLQSGLKWLFLDLNSYFASVEQQDNPRLRGRPIAVVPMMSDHTCAIAASAEAKRYGIRTGTIIRDAKRLCPSLICVPARHDAYVRYHHKVLEEVIRHTPINKIWSVDELSSRLPPNKRNRDAACALAGRIRQGIWDNVGEQINCSIGIAPNSFLAKIATDMQKPNGLVVIDPQDLPGPLLKLELTDLPGINVNMERRLNNAGIYTVGQLWDTSPKQARQIWGSVGGERFWYNLHGHNIPDLETSRSSIGHSRVLDPELRHPDSARLIARRLTVKAATRLRREAFFATRFSLSVRIGDGSTRWGNETRLRPSQDNFTFLNTLDNLWSSMEKDMKPHRIKKFSVTLYGLKKQEETTRDLFGAPEKQSSHNEKLSQIMDHINKKHGSESISLGITPATRTGYVGTKIAFSRVPDREEFHE